MIASAEALSGHKQIVVRTVHGLEEKVDVPPPVRANRAAARAIARDVRNARSLGYAPADQFPTGSQTSSSH